MGNIKDKSVDQKIGGATQAVPAKTGEVSDAELEKVAGGAPNDLPSTQVSLNYTQVQVEYTK